MADPERRAVAARVLWSRPLFIGLLIGNTLLCGAALFGWLLGQSISVGVELLLLLLCNLVGLCWFAHETRNDVRASRATLAELALRTTQLDLVASQLPAIFWVADHALILTSVSGSGLRGIAVDPATVIGKPLQAIMGNDASTATIVAVHRAALTGTPGRYSRTVADRLFEVQVTPLWAPDRTVIAAMGMAYDVTERDQAQQALRRYLDRQATLRTIDQALLAADSPTALVRLIAPPLRQLMPHTRLALAVVSESYAALHTVTLTIATGQIEEHDTALPNLLDLGVPTTDPSHLLLPATDPRAAALLHGAPPTEHVLGLPIAQGDQLIGVLSMSLNHAALAAEQLGVLHEVAVQLAVILERLRLIAQISEGRARLQDLTSRLVATQEAERHAIACDLHDEVGQALTGLKLLLELARRQHSQDPRLTEAQIVVGELLVHVRNLSLDLRPSMLNDSGLLPTLIWLCDRYQSRTGIAATVRHQGLDARFTPDVEITAYRVIQEALTNVARHAGVDRVQVIAAADELTLTLCVVDTGCGFDVPAALANHQSFGLLGVRERVALVSGKVEIESTPGQGTRVQVELPLGGFMERRVASR